MHAFDAVKNLANHPVETLDTATLRYMQEGCRKWLGEHTAWLALLDGDVRASTTAFWEKDEQDVHATLRATSAELSLRSAQA